MLFLLCKTASQCPFSSGPNILCADDERLVCLVIFDLGNDGDDGPEIGDGGAGESQEEDCTVQGVDWDEDPSGESLSG